MPLSVKEAEACVTLLACKAIAYAKSSSTEPLAVPGVSPGRIFPLGPTRYLHFSRFPTSFSIVTFVFSSITVNAHRKCQGRSEPTIPVSPQAAGPAVSEREIGAGGVPGCFGMPGAWKSQPAPGKARGFRV